MESFILNTFLNFLKHIEEEELDILINYKSFYVYEFFSEWTNFEEAINILKRAFNQEKSEIYTRYLLATRTQQAEEVLDRYLQALHILAKAVNSKMLPLEFTKRKL